MTVFFRNYSVSLLLTIQPTKEFLSIPHNVTYLSGTVYGSQLGLQGKCFTSFIRMVIGAAFQKLNVIILFIERPAFMTL